MAAVRQSAASETFLPWSSVKLIVKVEKNIVFSDDYQCNSDSIQYNYYMNFEGKWSRIGKLTQVELIVCIAPNLSC